MDMKPLVVACIPAFNEEGSIAGVVVRLVDQAKAMGCERALEWLHDMSFVRYLTFIDINQPIGYRSEV